MPQKIPSDVLNKALFDRGFPANLADFKFVKEYQAKSLQDFKTATSRQRTLFGYELWEAGPGDRLSKLYTAYGNWEKNILDVGAAQKLSSATADYLGVPDGIKGLAMFGNDPGANINQASRDERGRDNFTDLLKYTQLISYLFSYNPKQANMAALSWQAKQKITRENVVIFFGNIKISYDWTSAVGVGLLSVGAASSSVIGADNLSKAAEFAKQNPGLITAAATLPTICTGAYVFSNTASNSDAPVTDDGSAHSQSAWEKFKSWISALFSKMKEFLKKQMQKIFHYVDVNYIGSVISTITSAIFAFILKESFPLVSPSLAIAQNAAGLLQSEFSRLNLLAASADIGIKDQYWSIVQGSLVWGEQMASAGQAAGILAGIVKIIVTVFSGPAAPLAALIIAGISLLYKLVTAYMEQESINLVTVKAQQMAQKIKAYQLAKSSNSAVDTTSEQLAKERDLDNALSDIKLIASRNQLTQFSPEACTAEEIIHDRGGQYVSFLSTICYASPVLACVLVNSGLMGNPMLVTHSASRDGASELTDALAINYIKAAAHTARRLYTTSNFSMTPMPLDHYFSNIKTDWKDWVQKGNLNDPQVISA